MTEQEDVGSVSYAVSNGTPYEMRLTSDAFRGFKQDKWFFSRADFSAEAENSAPCLSAYGY